MTPPTPAPLGQLPETLRRQFAAMEQRLWRMDTTVAIGGTVCGLLLSFTFLFLSDRLWDTPVWLRTLSSLAALGAAAYFGLGWFRLWALQRRDTKALAEIIQRHHRRLGDRLLGVVELADESRRPANVSPALCQAAIAQVAREAGPMDFSAAVAARRPRLIAATALGLLTLVAIPFVLFPDASLNALKRWFLPGASITRYTFVQLSDLPARLVVPHGEPFEINCGVTPRSFWKPATATSQFARQPAVEAAVKSGHALFKIPGQTQPGTLSLRAGDATRQIAIEPTHRPALKQFTASLELPAYLHYPVVEQPIQQGRLSYLEGTRLTFRGQTTRNLASAELRDAQPQAQPLAVTAASFTSPMFTPTGAPTLHFTWQDELGLRPQPALALLLQPQRDAAPLIELPDQPRETAILEDEIIPLRLTATDDFGVKELGLRYDFTQPQKAGGDDVTRTNKVKTGAHTERKLAGVFEFSPGFLGIPAGTVVSVRGTATDYFPGRAPAESSVHRLLILSREEHARMIQEQLEKLRVAIEELTRKQENLTGETKRVQDQKPDQQATPETAKKLGEQSDEQKENARTLERISEDGLRTLKDGLRNKSLPTKMLKDWAQSLEQMQNVAKQEMGEATDSLKSAQQNPAKRPTEVAKAVEKEEQALKALQELQRKMSNDLDKMQALTLSKRLRKVGETEQGVDLTLQKTLAETIGLRREELPAPTRAKLSGLAGDQERASKDTAKIHEEITRFHQRTDLASHGKVSQEMKQTKVVDELAQVSELIRENISAQARQQAQNWAKRILAWADELEAGEKESDEESGESGEPQKMEKRDLEKLLALIRVRQDQENLNEHTRLLETDKATRPTYAKDATELGTREGALKKEVGDLQKERVFAKVKERLKQAGQVMDEAEYKLATPLTDEPTQAAETDALNLIDDAIKTVLQSQQKNQKPSSGMSALQQMMQMGQQPGEGMNSALSDRANKSVNGDGRGKDPNARKVQKLSGRDTRTLPAEYRDAIQGYFNAVEKP
ncbi:hypothetical protein LBMAG56_29090 [Verrucomicrobiota bacterium]|nr:hypothetical protein LBMAG56_29090 [Verrucomicrobiota bacterium]